MEFKSAIKYSLQNHHWEIVEVENLDEWWEEEHWKIQWRLWKTYIVYSVLIDQARCEVTVTTQLFDNKCIVSSLPMSIRKLSIKLKEFVLGIEDFREK